MAFHVAEETSFMVRAGKPTKRLCEIQSYLNDRQTSVDTRGCEWMAQFGLPRWSGARLALGAQVSAGIHTPNCRTRHLLDGQIFRFNPRRKLRTLVY